MGLKHPGSKPNREIYENEEGGVDGGVATGSRFGSNSAERTPH